MPVAGLKLRKTPSIMAQPLRQLNLIAEFFQNNHKAYAKSLGYLSWPGMAMEMMTVHKINREEIHRQALSPPHWKAQPESTVPVKRPMALAI